MPGEGPWAGARLQGRLRGCAPAQRRPPQSAPAFHARTSSHAYLTSFLFSCAACPRVFLLLASTSSAVSRVKQAIVAIACMPTGWPITAFATLADSHLVQAAQVGALPARGRRGRPLGRLPAPGCRALALKPGTEVGRLQEPPVQSHQCSLCSCHQAHISQAHVSSIRGEAQALGMPLLTLPGGNIHRTQEGPYAAKWCI